MIEVSNVSKSSGNSLILEGITVSVDDHRTAVIGANGSGKTTFARLLNGLMLPDSGEVLVFRKSTRKDGRHARRNVGLVFQNPDTQIVMPTVEEDLAFGLENLKVPKAEIASRVEEWLQAYGLWEKRNDPAHLLSGGEKKLLSILSVLIMEPALVVFDEPLASLDLVNRTRILSLIERLPQPAVVLTHDLDTIAHYDRVLVLDKGRLIANDTPAPAIAAYLERVQRCSPSMPPATPSSTKPVPAPS